MLNFSLLVITLLLAKQSWVFCTLDDWSDKLTKRLKADRVSWSVILSKVTGFPLHSGTKVTFPPLICSGSLRLYVLMSLLFSLWDNLLLLVFLTETFSVLWLFHRFTGGHPGCGLGLQCSHGSIQDPVPNPRFVGLLDNSSRYVHLWNLAPFTDATLISPPARLQTRNGFHPLNANRCIVLQGLKGQGYGTCAGFAGKSTLNAGRLGRVAS